MTLSSIPPQWRTFLASWKRDCAEIIRTGRDPSFSLDQIVENVISLREQNFTYPYIAKTLSMTQHKVLKIIQNCRPDLQGRRPSGDAIN